MLHIIYRHGRDFSLLNQDGETPLMIAITLGNTGAINEILNYWNIDISSDNNETILYYAARHGNPKIAVYACDPTSDQIKPTFNSSTTNSYTSRC
jgi:ankyrin repeat protein